MHTHTHAHAHADPPPRTVHAAHVPAHTHDHDDEPLGPIEDNPIWQQDNVTLHSVGIDIGSSGTQVLFSRLRLRRIGEELTSRYHVVSRETRYLSPVALTPYTSGEHIDAVRLGEIVDEAYGKAGVTPDAIDTGVVILTGEALRRHNAEAIAGVLAERGGRLVTATAGHHMEAQLAAYGSGAARRSYERRQRLLVVDIGGGTTKLAVVEGGRVLSTAAVHIGGRLQVTDEDGRIVRLEPAGRHHAARAGLDWRLGDPARPAELDRVAEAMAGALVDVLRGAPGCEDGLYLTRRLGDPGPLDGVLFSGGVAEYVYGREQRDFGDLGRRLGHAVRRRLDAGELPWPLLPAGECIRATALGASEYSVQLSGNTGCVSDPDALLPRRDLPVVRPHCPLGDTVDARAVADAVRQALDERGAEGDVALAVEWSGLPEYGRLLALATGIRDGLAARIAAGRPVYVVLDGDVAMTLGRLLREELGVTSEVLVVDGLSLHDFDHIDLGRVRHPSRTVPVTIKSLVFGTDGAADTADTADTAGTAGTDKGPVTLPTYG
ncbi:ethanolamine ammonia-lyase reactivating factor EutA [Streptomyces fradiae]